VKCEDVNELLIPYLDDELGKEEKKVVELHLSTCLRCREELETLAAIRTGARQALKVMAAKAIPPEQSWKVIEQRLAGKRQPKIALLSGAKSKLEGGINMIKGGLVSRPPAWKPAVIGVLVAALAVGLALVIPPHLGQSQEVLAAEIAQNDPWVRELLPEGAVIRVTKAVRPVEEGIFHVLFLIPGESIWDGEDGNKAIMIDTSVNVREKKVVGVRALKIEAAHITPLTEVEKEKAVEIAEANPEVQEILASGAEIRRVIPLPFFQPVDGSLTINVVGVVLTVASSDSQAKAERWIAVVDLVEGKVVEVVQYP